MIVDKYGAQRHAMTSDELDKLYKQFEKFIADCTREEVDSNSDAINVVLTMIHQHLNR